MSVKMAAAAVATKLLFVVVVFAHLGERERSSTLYPFLVESNLGCVSLADG